MLIIVDSDTVSKPNSIKTIHTKLGHHFIIFYDENGNWKKIIKLK